MEAVLARIRLGEGRETSRVRLSLVSGIALAVMAIGACTPAVAGGGSERRTSQRLDSVREKPPMLRAFLAQMPKGGDIHNHLSGAVYAESYIGWAAADGRCVSQTTWEVSNGPCEGDRVPVAKASTDDKFRDRLIDEWSMRYFVPTPDHPGHDQFFDSFSKFGGASPGHGGDMQAEVARRAAAQAVTYLELMLTPAGSPSRALGTATPWSDDLTTTINALFSNPELTSIISGARAQEDASESQMKAALKCGSAEAETACEVTQRYLSQVIRGFPREQVLSQMVVAFELARADSRFVGLNMVGPEDGFISMRDYRLHMQMLQVLHDRYPDVKISLHAGELTLGVVPPDGLAFHIRDAVQIAHASRIGHGVDIGYEMSPTALMKTMADNKIAVEILLTSNAQILGVDAARHPFQSYRSAGVPVVIGTDDEGVARSDMTNEYQRAVEGFGLTYKELKQIARASLEYSFLSGPGLWRDFKLGARADECSADDPSTDLTTISKDCREYLAKSEKAAAQWRLEHEFIAFERTSVRAV